MESEKSHGSSGITGMTPGGASSIVVQRVTQMLSDCLEYTSRLNASRDWNYTELCLKLKAMQEMMRNLSSFIDVMIANGSSYSHSKTGSKCIKSQASRRNTMEEIKVQLDENAIMPTRAHSWDAGLDLYTPVDCHVCFMESKVIDTGVHVEIPEGYVGLVKSKSGLMMNNALTTDGVVDAGYSGSIKVRMFNHHWAECYDFAAGDKIAQLLIVPCETPETKLVDNVDAGERGDNGFGSTGR